MRGSSAPAVAGTPRAKTEDEAFVEERILQIREELLGIADEQKRKSRLRELQREYHPDKNPTESSARVTPIFHYVQRWWEDLEGVFKREHAAHKRGSGADEEGPC